MSQAAHVAPPAEKPDVPRLRNSDERRSAALDDAKRSFLRMVSHELRTPLNSILGFSEIIASELYGPLGAPQYKEYAEIIQSSGQRLLKLVNQILEIARLEGHATDLKPAPELLDHALDDVLDGLKDELAEHDTRIAIEERGALPSVIADARGLRTILNNLIHNAIVFGPQGGEVHVRTRLVRDWVEIAVVDQGEGIDPLETHRLLKPFEQGENALIRRTEGAGLGLPIVDLLCSAMGGRLQLDPDIGGGLRAVVRLPAA